MATTEIQGELLKAGRWSAGDKGRRQLAHRADHALSSTSYATTYHFGVAKGKTARCLDSHRASCQGLAGLGFFPPH